MNDFLGRYWYIMLIGVVNGLLVFGLWWFYERVIDEQRAHAETLRRELVRHEKNRRLLKEREDLLMVWEEYRPRIDRFFFTTDRLVEWLEFLEQEARARNLVFEASSLDEKDESGHPHLRAAVKGKSDGILDFLYAVQSGSYGIDLKEGTMRKEPSSTESFTQITFVFYEASSR